MIHPFSKPFTLDRTVRLFLFLLIFISIVLLFRHLSPVLLPFFVACLIAYLLHPLVVFTQRKLKIKNRTIVVFFILLFFLTLIGSLFYFLTPALISEIIKLKNFVLQFATDESITPDNTWQIFLQEFLISNKIPELLNAESMDDLINELFPHIYQILSSSWSLAGEILTGFVSLLYLFFILKDYNSITQHFISLIPNRYQNFVSTLLHDMGKGMNNYYRGQFLVVIIVTILFSTGFSIIGMPIGLLMGIIVGLLNLVPYLQIIGIPPCILLMLVHSAETGTSPLYSLGALFIVFIIVQIIQDLFLVPKIMSKAMGLNAAIILLSLSIFSMLFGIIGLIIALPITTLLISYYKRYILSNVNNKYNTIDLSNANQTDNPQETR
ncbi:MAG: AI-2E family transporter [Paludibacteraceae bacterium]|nr:AI-2E family transporter [Paludibacteraceae bacterium]